MNHNLLKLIKNYWKHKVYLKKHYFLAFLISLTLYQTHLKADNLDIFTKPIKNLNESPLLIKISEGIQKTTFLHSTFVQEKTIPLLSKPLVSNGFFIFSKNNGVRWETSSPISSIFIISGDKIKTKNSSGRIIEIDSREQIALHNFTKLMNSLFSGNINSLFSDFEVFFSGTETNWEIGLKPTAKELSKFMDLVRLKGSKNIDQLTFSEKSGEKTKINFTDISESSKYKNQNLNQIYILQ